MRFPRPIKGGPVHTNFINLSQEAMYLCRDRHGWFLSGCPIMLNNKTITTAAAGSGGKRSAGRQRSLR